MGGGWRTTSSYGGGSMDGPGRTGPRSGDGELKDWLRHSCEERGTM